MPILLPNEREMTCLSFDIELLTAVEFQTLRAYEIQRRYKNPVFAYFHAIVENPKWFSFVSQT